MPTAFAITAASTTFRLEAGEVQFTVTNTSGRPLRARLHAVALQPEAQGWFTVLGEAERPFALGETQQVSIRLAVPPQTPAGSYAVRLDAAAEDNPDDDSVQGPSVTVEVPPPPPKKRIPWWLLLAAVAVLVLLIGGGAALFLLRGDGGTEIPNVAGQPVADAEQLLLVAGLTRGELRRERSDSVAKDLVIRTDPAAGEKVGDDEPVDLIVADGPTLVTLPPPESIIGHNYMEATDTIQKVCGDTPCLTVNAIPVSTSGVFEAVISMTPEAGTQVERGSTVTLFYVFPIISSRDRGWGN